MIYCEYILQQLELDEVVTMDCVRLVRYNEFQDWVERSFDGEDETAFGNLLGGVKSMYTFDLLLEIKRPEQLFQEYKPGGRCLISISLTPREHPL